MNNKKNIIGIGRVFLVIIIISIIGIVMAQGAAPEQFYGNVTINDTAAPDNTPVSAWINGVEKETQTTVDGKYGVASAFYVSGESGDTIVFKIFGSEVGTNTLNFGGLTEKDLVLADELVDTAAQPDDLPTYTNTTFVLINWTANPGLDTSGIDHYELLRGTSASGPFVTINVTSDNTQATYNNTSLSDGTYYYRLRTWDVVGNVKNATTDVNTTVDIIVPKVVIDTPTETSPVYRKGGEQFWVNFTYTELNPANYTVEIRNSSTIINTTQNSSVVGGENLFANESFNLNSTVADGQYNVTVTIYDNASNSNVSYQNYSVVKDDTPPNVTLVSPTDGATGVTITTTISATFSEAMNTTSVENAFSVTGVTGTVTYDAGTRTATFDPTANLAYSTTYTVTISTGAKDLVGNSMANAYTWAFTTASAPPSRPIGGGGGNPDIDDDGISNIDEMMAGTDRYNPCDPNPYNEACYAIGGARPTTPTPEVTPTPTPSPTPTPELTPEPTPTGTPTPIKEFPLIPIVVIPIVVIVAIVVAAILVAYVMWRGKK